MFIAGSTTRKTKMKVLLIDNHTDHLYNFRELFLSNQVEIQQYRPGLDFHISGKDLVVLSGGGGEGFELKDTTDHGQLWYEDEMNFVLACKKPIVGVCMGFEVICAAYGSTINHVGQLVKGFKTNQVSTVGKKHLLHDKLRQYEYHRYGAQDVSSKYFETLAYSQTGIEMVKHKNRPIIATQFHPEKGGTLQLSGLIGEFST